MSTITDSNPAPGQGAGLNKTSLGDAENISRKIDVPQAKNLPTRVLIAKRELLRDFAHEAACAAADHAEILAKYIAMDDAAGLKYSVAAAREAAKASRELIGAA